MNRILLGIGLFFASFLLAEMPSLNLPPKITLRVPPEGSVEGREITLYITIVRDPKQKIHLETFRLDDKSLKLKPVQEQIVAPKQLFQNEIDAGLVVERFQVTLPPRAAGVYSIGPVFVRVGDAVYHSGSITVYVQGAVSSEQFRLECKVNAPPKIFPGQTVSFEYRIYYTLPLQIIREDLPLLHVSGFQNLGSPEVEDQTSGEENVQIIRQRAKAVTPGTVSIGESLMEAMQLQNETLIPPLMRAITAPVDLQILSFPEKGRPVFFDGALGSFVWRISRLERADVKIGEKVRVEYRVSGRGVLDTVSFPPIERLKGLQNSFWAAEPVDKVEEGTKTFILEVRPRHAGENLEIPGFFFASFDPVSEKYLTRTIPPVVFNVEGGEAVEAEPAPFEGELAAPFELEKAKAKGFSLSVLFVVLVVLALLGVGQWLFFKLRKKPTGPTTSKDLFYQAVKNRSKRMEGLQFLKKALYLRLYELGLTSTIQESPEGIREEGILIDVKNLLRLIDRELYHEERVNLQEVYDEASLLYYKLKQLR